MSGYPYDGTDDYPTTLTLPAGSDLKNVSTVDVPLEGLANRTTWLLRRTYGAENNAYFIPLMGDQVSGSGYPPEFRLSAVTSVGYGWVQTDNSAPGELRFPIPLPGKGNITHIRAWVASQNTHSGLPGTMPVFSVYSEFPYLRQTAVQVATLVDGSLTVGEYEDIHPIDLDTTGALEVDMNDPTKTFVLYAVFNGESGANSQPGALVLKGIDVTFTA